MNDAGRRDGANGSCSLRPSRREAQVFNASFTTHDFLLSNVVVDVNGILGDSGQLPSALSSRRRDWARTEPKA